MSFFLTNSLLVAAAPNMHFFRIGNQLFAEIGMRNGDQRLGTLPGRKSLQIDHSILGNNIVRAGARVGADGAGGKRGNDTALYAAVFAGDGGRHADEALAALGKIRAQQEIELTARAGDVFGDRKSVV